MKIIASVAYAHRVSEDEWKTVRKTLICNENTTLGEIDNWLKDKIGFKYPEKLEAVDLSIPYESIDN